MLLITTTMTVLGNNNDSPSLTSNVSWRAYFLVLGNNSNNSPLSHQMWVGGGYLLFLGDNNEGRTMMTNRKQYTTHPQPHEQLLMGWIAGGMLMMTTWQQGQDDNDDKHRTMTMSAGWQQQQDDNNEHRTMVMAGWQCWQRAQDDDDDECRATTTLMMSAGQWWWWQVQDNDDDNEHRKMTMTRAEQWQWRWGQKDDNDNNDEGRMMTMTTRAGWQGGPEDHHHNSTPNHCHKQLLIGWKWGAMSMGTMRRHHLPPSHCKHEWGDWVPSLQMQAEGLCITINILSLYLMYLTIYQKCSLLQKPMVNHRNHGDLQKPVGVTIPQAIPVWVWCSQVWVWAILID